MPAVETPEELRVFLNGGALDDLVQRWRLANKGDAEKSFSVREEDRELSVSWLHKATRRSLVVQNSLNRLPGMFLSLPVHPDEYKVGRGDISASFTTWNEDYNRVPEPYNEGMMAVGKPQVVVKIVIVTAQELSVASGIVPREDI